MKNEFKIIRRRHWNVAALVAITLFVSTFTHAQSVPVPSTWAWAYGPNSTNAMGTIYCGTGPMNPQLGAGTYSTGCTSASGLPGATFEASGRAGAGQIGVRTSIDAAGLGFPNGPPSSSSQQDWGTAASSSWADRVSFAGVLPGTIELTVSWDGRLAGNLSFINPDIFNLGQGGFASALWNFKATSPEGQLVNYTNSASIGVYRSATVRTLDVADVRTFIVPVGASGFVDFMYDLRTGADVLGVFYGNIQVTGRMSSDFANTGKLIGFVARDAAGIDITAQTQYRFANGTQISAVPEPGAWAILSIGLLAIGGLVRRQRVV